MNTKLFSGLVLAFALLAAGPAFGDRGGGGGGGRGGGGGGHVAAFSGGGGRGAVFSGGGYRGGGFSSRPSFALGGSSRSFSNGGSVSGGRSYTGGRSFSGGRGGGTFAFSSHPGWSHNNTYFSNGHYYRWYNNGWFLFDYPYAGYPYYDYYGGDYGPDYGDNEPNYTVYGPSYYNDQGNQGGSVVAGVQAELARDGYYRGPVDGIIGPMTQAAIAAYQRDNGLHVTGTINSHLLDSMDLD